MEAIHHDMNDDNIDDHSYVDQCKRRMAKKGFQVKFYIRDSTRETHSQGSTTSLLALKDSGDNLARALSVEGP